jgi:hypothetical protein
MIYCSIMPSSFTVLNRSKLEECDMKFMTKQDEIVKLRRAATTSWVLLLFVFAGLTGCANKHSPSGYY